MNTPPPPQDDLSTLYRNLGKPVKEKDEGMRLDMYLGKYFLFFSRAVWQQRIESGEVLINQIPARKVSIRLKANDEILYFHPHEKEPEIEDSIDIFYQDHGVLGANKPASLPMHEGGKYRFQTFSNWIQKQAGKEWSAVHRLDKETSGIVLCGNSLETRSFLGKQFRDHTIKKVYLAIVFGHPKETEWECSQPIGDLEESEIRIKKWIGGRDAQNAFTKFEVIDTKGAYSLLRCFPTTGRTNQIRIHAAASGFPLVGDKLFHHDEKVFLDYWKNGTTDWILTQVIHHRCLLHAEQIEFVHPFTNQLQKLKVPPPRDWQKFWSQIDIDNLAQ